MTPDTINLLKECNAVKPVTVELGLQSADDAVAKYINRGYQTCIYADAVARRKKAGDGIPWAEPDISVDDAGADVGDGRAGQDGEGRQLLRGGFLIASATRLF